jgi:hypothetical protein
MLSRSVPGRRRSRSSTQRWPTTSPPSRRSLYLKDAPKERPKKKTVEELDAEMADYFPAVDPNNNNMVTSTDGARTAVGGDTARADSEWSTLLFLFLSRASPKLPMTPASQHQQATCHGRRDALPLWRCGHGKTDFQGDARQTRIEATLPIR